MGFPGSVLVAVLVGFYVSGSSDADLKITAEPGDDVTLTCKAPENMKMKSLEWTRVDLQEGEYVFVYRNRGINLDDQHESFRNRVSLNNSQMKDGDLSVVLKNVTVNDTGTYTCSVMRENDPDREMILIGSVHLSVIPPGDKDGVSHGNLGLIPLSGLLLLTIFLAPGLVIYRKKQSSNQRSNNQRDVELGLNSDSKADRSMTDSVV